MKGNCLTFLSIPGIIVWFLLLRGCRINNQIINIISVVRKTMLVKQQKCLLPWRSIPIKACATSGSGDYDMLLTGL